MNYIPPRRSDGTIQHARLKQSWPQDRPFRILSIDGGGIRGVFPALPSLTRRVNACDTPTRSVSEGLREKWWAERGSQRFINDSDSLESAIVYVRDGQDMPREESH